jgi:hypothetical protein
MKILRVARADREIPDRCALPQEKTIECAFARLIDRHESVCGSRILHSHSGLHGQRASPLLFDRVTRLADLVDDVLNAG